MTDLSKEIYAQDKKLCAMHHVLNRMPKDERRVVLNALQNTETYVPATRLATVLKKRGYDISDTTIQRHRKGVCACG